jgi:hypothetical protein
MSWELWVGVMTIMLTSLATTHIIYDLPASFQKMHMMGVTKSGLKSVQRKK